MPPDGFYSYNRSIAIALVNQFIQKCPWPKSTRAISSKTPASSFFHPRWYVRIRLDYFLESHINFRADSSPAIDVSASQKLHSYFQPCPGQAPNLSVCGRFDDRAIGRAGCVLQVSPARSASCESRRKSALGCASRRGTSGATAGFP